MNCKFCGSDPDPVVLLNIPSDPGIPFSCIPCAREHGLYCDLHQVGHSEYPPDGTTCPSCVSELARRNKRRGPKFLREIYVALPPAVSDELNDYFDYNEDAPDMEWRAWRLTTELSLRASCRRVPLRAVVEEICRTQSIRPIFP